MERKKLELSASQKAMIIGALWSARDNNNVLTAELKAAKVPMGIFASMEAQNRYCDGLKEKNAEIEDLIFTIGDSVAIELFYNAVEEPESANNQSDDGEEVVDQPTTT